MEVNDPLFVCSSKVPCPLCGGGRKERKSCEYCYGSGFKPVDLNGLWHPSPGFLVCGGPSANMIPKDKLRERGIVSLAVNNVAGHMPVKAWVFSDPQTKFHHGVFLDPSIMTFAPVPKLRKTIRFKTPDGIFKMSDTRVMDCPNTFGFSRQTAFYPELFLSTFFGHWGMGGKMGEDRNFNCIATMLLGVRLMHYLGCPRVYMIGVDFQRTEDAQYAFEQTASVRNGRYSKEARMLSMCKPHFEKAGFQIFNCNPESKCDVFPYVPLDEAFEDCKGAVPDEPLDLADWYSYTVAEKDEKEHPGVMTLPELQARERLRRQEKRGQQLPPTQP